MLTRSDARTVRLLSGPLFALGVLLTTAGLQAGDGKPSPKSTDNANAVLALRGLDPVLLTRGKEVPGNSAVTAARGDYRYQFADVRSREAFEKDPTRYAVQLNGACALMPHAQGDPDLFAVHNGRIYLFGTARCRTTFLADPDKVVKP